MEEEIKEFNMGFRVYTEEGLKTPIGEVSTDKWYRDNELILEMEESKEENNG